jgi:hypothetical protein
MAEVSMSRTASPASVAQAWLPFEELVQAHWNWQESRDPASESAYRAKLAAFEGECGEIVDSYWCTSVPSAVALTEQPRRGRTSQLRFHRVSDWATKNEPEIAALLHKCDELTIKIARILRAPTRDIAMRLVVSSATHLLSLVDRRAEHRRHDDRESALALERQQLEEAERYYEEVGQRQAQLVYLRGMIGGTLVIAVFALGIWWSFDFMSRGIVLATALGAAGALLSVMSRMTDRKQGFELDYELGRRPLVVFGIFRPLLGAAFGLVLYAAIASGIVRLQINDSGTQTYFYALLSFAAGWSERLAKDVLDAADTTVGAAIRAKQAPATLQARPSSGGAVARPGLGHGP